MADQVKETPEQRVKNVQAKIAELAPKGSRQDQVRQAIAKATKGQYTKTIAALLGQSFTDVEITAGYTAARAEDFTSRAAYRGKPSGEAMSLARKHAGNHLALAYRMAARATSKVA